MTAGIEPGPSEWWALESRTSKNREGSTFCENTLLKLMRSNLFLLTSVSLIWNVLIVVSLLLNVCRVNIFLGRHLKPLRSDEPSTLTECGVYVVSNTSLCYFAPKRKSPARIISHPDHNRQDYTNDIALVRLDVPVGTFSGKCIASIKNNN